MERISDFDVLELCATPISISAQVGRKHLEPLERVKSPSRIGFGFHRARVQTRTKILSAECVTGGSTKHLRFMSPLRYHVERPSAKRRLRERLLRYTLAVTCTGFIACDDAVPESAPETFRQYRTDLLPDNSTRSIRIYVQGALRNDDIFMEAVDKAVNSWNEAGDLRFSFSLAPEPPPFIPPITDTEWPIVIKPANEGGCCPFMTPRTFEGIAYAERPFRDLGRINPGAEIRFNVACMQMEAPHVQHHILMHEIGHTVGLRHTDWRTQASCDDPYPENTEPGGANHIDGTPQDDPRSVMVACYDPETATGTWSEGDLAAIQELFGR